MSSNPVAVKLVVATSSATIAATLTYTNTSSENAFIEKINGCLDGHIDNNVFELTADNRRIDYTGILVKRRAPGPDDFVKLPPGEKLITTVRLEETYEFLPGSHTYRVVYSALHSYPEHPGFIELKSNEEKFSFTK